MAKMQTCRFCGEQEYDGRKLLQFGIRHHAHHGCYLSAGRDILALSDSQIAAFPFRLLQRFNLVAAAEPATLRELAREDEVSAMLAEETAAKAPA